MLDDLCQIGLRGAWGKLVSENSEEESRNQFETCQIFYVGVG